MSTSEKYKVQRRKKIGAVQNFFVTNPRNAVKIPSNETISMPVKVAIPKKCLNTLNQLGRSMNDKTLSFGVSPLMMSTCVGVMPTTGL